MEDSLALSACLIVILMIVGGFISIGIGANKKDDKKKHDALIGGGVAMWVVAGIILGILCAIYK